MGITREQTTRLVQQLSETDGDAAADLFPIVYERLHQIALSFFRQQPSHHTLQPTALVHEAYLKLCDHAVLDPDDRARFVRIAARAMRQVLIDHARARQAEKRGGGWGRITLQGISDSPSDPIDLLALDDALERLAALDARQASVVELRFFGGLTVEEAATALGVSPRTIELDWRMAKAWLGRELEGGPA